MVRWVESFSNIRFIQSSERIYEWRTSQDLLPTREPFPRKRPKGISRSPWFDRFPFPLMDTLSETNTYNTPCWTPLCLPRKLDYFILFGIAQGHAYMILMNNPLIFKNDHFVFFPFLIFMNHLIRMKIGNYSFLFVTFYRCLLLNKIVVNKKEILGEDD